MAAEASRIRSIADLPGPSRLPLIGNSHQLVPYSRMHLTFEEWARRYGPIFRVSVGRRKAIVISDVDEINAILRNRPEGFRRWSEQQKVSQEMMSSRSLIYAEGADWKRQRRLVVTALNTHHLHSYFHVISVSTERLYRRLGEAAHDGRVLDIQHELTSFNVDITSALAFGQDLNTLERGENELQGHIHRLLQMTARRLALPIPYWRWFRLPADRALEHSVSEIGRAVNEFIEQARMRVSERPELREAPENFLEGMVVAQEADDSYTDNEIVGNTLAILTAGEDTTAITMGWAIWFLASQPDIQARLAQEATEVLGEHPFPSEHETVARLHYTEAVLREAMRLKSVVPMLTVEPLMDTTICDTHIPKETRLLLLTHYAGMQADIVKPERFDPDRWLRDGDGDHQAPDQKSFLGFGAGPRFCPGHNLAFLEAKTALAMFARNFQVELDNSKGPVQEYFTFTRSPRGLRVRLRERAATQPMSLVTTG
jgi:cytochrome P450